MTGDQLVTTTASLNFAHPCHFCGVECRVVNGQRIQHICRIDLDAQPGRDVKQPCKHCRQPISDHLVSPLHLEGKQRGLQRCDPADSGLPYGYNAGRADTECTNPCMGAPITPSITHSARLAA